MKDTIENRVGSAAVAGWWTLLIAAVFLALMWVWYLYIVTAQPAWVLSLCGPGVTWPMLRTIILLAVSFLKIFLWLMAFVVTWLSLWAWQMRRR